MKRIFALLLCVCMAVAIVACEAPAKEADYKLGMGIVVDLNSSATDNAQVDATVATVVTDADGKIVVCRIDAVQNKMNIKDGAVEATKTFKTKMELGDDYNMAKYGQSMDWNGDGKVLEWYDQAKAFENYVVGKTAAEVEAIATKVVEGAGYVIAADEALLNAGCTIQITDFKAAVAKAAKDDQGMTFKAVPGSFTLGVAATSTAVESVAATAEANGSIKMYSDFAASVVVDGKIVASLNDAIQPVIVINNAGEIVEKTFTATKRELKEDYNMAKYGASMDWNGDGKVLEWYQQSEAFSKYVVGKTAAEVEAIATKVVEGSGYVIAADEALLNAGCTIQITDFKAAVVKACKDEQGMSFKAVPGSFTLGVAANSFVDAETKAATAEENGTVKMYSDFAASVVVDGKIVASLNDAIQPSITINAKGEIVEKTFKATKRELKEDYNMAKYGASMDWNGDGKVLEWYQQSEAFSKHVVGKTAAEVEAMATKVVEGAGYVISADDALLSAGCTIQITSIKAVVAKSVKNAR